MWIKLDFMEFCFFMNKIGIVQMIYLNFFFTIHCIPLFLLVSHFFYLYKMTIFFTFFHFFFFLFIFPYTFFHFLSSQTNAALLWICKGFSFFPCSTFYVFDLFTFLLFLLSLFFPFFLISNSTRFVFCWLKVFKRSSIFASWPSGSGSWLNISGNF